MIVFGVCFQWTLPKMMGFLMSMPKMKGFLMSIVKSTGSDATRCYSCKDSLDPTTCTETVFCQDDEVSPTCNTVLSNYRYKSVNLSDIIF